MAVLQKALMASAAKSDSVAQMRFAADAGDEGAAFAINYDGNPGQDGRPAGPALQV
jgi:hypothetical protein